LDTENSEYQSLNLNCTGKMNTLQSVIVDAEWHYMGIHFTVTFKNKFFKSNEYFFHSIIFEQDLKALALLEECRSEKILLLEYKNKKDEKKFYLFTCGGKVGSREFKYGICKITLDLVNTLDLINIFTLQERCVPEVMLMLQECNFLCINILNIN